MLKNLLTTLFTFSILFCYAFPPPTNDTVEVAGFLGSANSDGVEIYWTTNTESGVDEFVLERSLNAVDFEEISITPSAGNSSSTQDYSYMDAYNYRQLVYYRLKTVMDSEVKYSTVIAVSRTVNTHPDIDIFPTLTNRLIRVVKNTDELFSNAQVRIFDRNGNLLRSETVSGDFINLEFDVSDLAAGMYILEIRDGKIANKAKFIKHN